MDSDTLKWANVFMPRALREIQRVRENHVRFVHYCSAESGLAILRSKRMFLRNSVLMNDFSEVDYGAQCLEGAWTGDTGARLKELLSQVQADLPQVIEQNHNSLLADVKQETYLMSISEHGGALEDKFGRLSMWRAYAARNGIALIFMNSPFINESDALKAYTSPVVYATPEEFEGMLAEVVDRIEENISELKERGGAFVHDFLIHVFRFAMQSTKHPAFGEEREWRVIYSPTILIRNGHMTEQQLQRVPTEIRCINGIPQRIFAIPFQNHPEDQLVGATIPELLDRILIGPSNDAYAIAQAFVAELEAAQVPDPANNVWITGVPLRT